MHKKVAKDPYAYSQEVRRGNTFFWLGCSHGSVLQRGAVAECYKEWGTARGLIALIYMIWCNQRVVKTLYASYSIA